ncbi:uncharacterized protein LOC101461278 [Ceratitis capitata]|uniref:uncharacterized protein LOC101461278 n=1 Tax=Ceratitis capitata TaxID=7213 RepID=UPI00032A1A65|nr:uncharacterized protein LOC101461278 [Ceratitis capitata]
MKFILLRFAIILLGCAIATRAAEEKNYKFILDEVFAEKESEDVGKIKVELVKSEEGVVINGQAEQLVDLDNEWKVKIAFKSAEDGNREYNSLMALPPMGVCDFMKFYYRMYIYESLVKYSNAPSPYVCPVVKDNYIVKDYPLISDKFKKFLRPGYHQIEASLYNGDEEKMKYIIEGHVVEETEN